MWGFLKNLTLEIPYDLAILHLDILPKRVRASYHNATYIPMFTAAPLTMAGFWEQLQHMNGDNSSLKKGKLSHL